MLIVYDTLQNHFLILNLISVDGGGVVDRATGIY